MKPGPPKTPVAPRPPRNRWSRGPERNHPPRNARRLGDAASLAVIVLLGALLYGNTLGVPWYLDDVRVIVENSAVHSLSAALGNFLSAKRGVAELTFALNHRFGGAQVAGYHLVNIAIHLAAACVVFLLLRRVFRGTRLYALGGALIFVAHPLQTQAVTYIVQRMTSLAGLFFFLALYLYARARETRSGADGEASTRHWLFYAGALLFGALAVLTKENAAVLPVALILFDRFFLSPGRPRAWPRLLLYVAPFCLVPGWLGAKSLLLPMVAAGELGNVGGVPDLIHLRNLSPLSYLVTELSVIWLYVRLLFLPYGQALDYDIPIVSTLWSWPSAVALLGIMLLFVAAALLRRRLPVISAGILWFFVALAVESTIIPLDPVFEHRLYVPMFGFALVVMGGTALLPRRGAVAAVVLVTAVLGGLTWQRNALWNDPVAFYEDNLRRAPRSERVHLDLANLYMKRGRVAEAQTLYERALAINPGYVLIHINLSRAYAAQGRLQEAVAILQEGLRRNPAHFKLHNNIAVLHNVLGDYRAAAQALETAVQLEPGNATVHFNLGVAYDRQDLTRQAIEQFRRSIALVPSNAEAHFNLGNALFAVGDARGALDALLTAHRLNPDHAGTVHNAALVCLDLGDLAGARRFAAILQRLDPGLANRLAERIR